MLDGACDVDKLVKHVKKLGMPAENAIANGVKRSSPNAGGALRGKRCYSIEHFPRGLVGEGEQKNAPCRHALLE